MFNELRERHYPSALNIVPAHVTLFHHLPGAEERAVCVELSALCAVQRPVNVRVSGLRDLGRGVAFRLESYGLLSVRSTLSKAWAHWLTKQDQQPYHPHITVQNKVHRDDAKRAFAELSAGFEPWNTDGLGLDLWAYLNGPWEHREYFAFQGPIANASESQ